MERFVQALPEDSGLAYVIIQHLSIKHKSHMAELLDRLTPLKVEVVTETVEILPNTIYVREPAHELQIEGTQLVPIDRIMIEPEAFYPIDRFLISLAEQRNERSIGIILSGMGTDGSRGVDMIKENGGLVLVQSPESAQFTAMPLAAMRNDVADLVGTPEVLASRLLEMVDREISLRAELANDKEINSNELAERLVKVIHKKVGYDFTNYRSSTIHRRVEKRMLITQVDNNREYLEVVLNDHEECHTLAKSFLIGVTRFFRDAEAFEKIREEVIPDLFKNADPDRPIRIWTPSCSTGEEAYTLAILMMEYRKQHRPKQDFKILASDIDPVSIKVANEGSYLEHIKADVPQHLLDAYFTPELGSYRISPRLQDHILFAVQDVLRDPPFIRVDLITCRNFLIYVNIEAQARVLANFHFALNPGGYLMLGPSENLGKLQNAFAAVQRRWKIYSRLPYDSLPMPAFSQLTSSNRMGTRETEIAINTKTTQHMADRTHTPLVRDPYAQFLSERFAPVSLFVDRNYDVLYINGDVDGLFRFPRHHMSFNLQKILSANVSSILTSSVDTLLEEGNRNSSDQPINIPEVEMNGSLFTIICSRAELAELSASVVHIIFRHSDGTTVEDASGDGDDVITNKNQLIQRRIQTLEAQLLQSNVKAQKLLSELEATNEELQTSNRELLASNEEMQSTNEELQSVNEELHTVNNEIQHKNEQLKHLNNDINHLLESTEIGTIFLDDKLDIRRFTPSVRKLFNLHPSDVGRPLSAFSSPFKELNLAQKCQEVLETFHRYEEEVIDRVGQTYLLRILPYRDLQDKEVGLVITFINIGDLVETRKQLEEMASKYEALVQYSADTIAIVNTNGRIIELNNWVREGVEPQSLLGTYLTDLVTDDRQTVILSNALRNMFDNRQSDRITLTIGDEVDEEMHLDVTLIPAYDPPVGEPLIRDTIMIMMRDISREVRYRLRAKAIMEAYQQQLEELNVEGGLTDLEGNVVDWNWTEYDDVTAETFKQRNIREFLTDIGLKKFNPLYERLRNGSFEEVMDYIQEDTTLVFPEGVKRLNITYRPLIIDGNLRFITIQTRPYK